MADNDTNSKGKSRPRPLNVQMDTFCIYYTSIGTETFGKGKASAIAANYAEASAVVRAAKLLQLPKIQERIVEIHRENMAESRLTVFTVLADLSHDRELARAKKDYSTCVRATELMGKYLAMFTDKALIELTDMRQLDDAHRETARRVAAALLSSGALDNTGDGSKPATPPGAPTTDVGRALVEREAKPVEQPVNREAGMDETLLGQADVEQPALEAIPQPKPVKRKRSKWDSTHAETVAELNAEEKRQDNPDNNSETAMLRRNQKRNKHYEQSSCVND